jgi:hypothetical protein
MLARLGRSSGEIPPARLAELYHSQIESVLAHLRARADQFHFIEVDFNMMMHDARPMVDQVSDFLGGLDVDRMLAAIDPKLYRVRQAAASPMPPEEVAA